MKVSSKPQILLNYEQSMSKINNMRKPNPDLFSRGFASIAVCMALIVTIPLIDTTYAKPKFDSSALGKQCASLNDVISALLAKQSQLRGQGSDLSTSDQNALNQAMDSYMTSCYDKFGYPAREVNPKLDDLPTIEEDMVVEQTDQVETPKQNLPDITTDDMVLEQTEETTPQNSDSPPNTPIENGEVG